MSLLQSTGLTRANGKASRSGRLVEAIFDILKFVPRVPCRRDLSEEGAQCPLKFWSPSNQSGDAFIV
eukprot:7810425-Pyramimonas_sp.AAC.1